VKRRNSIGHGWGSARIALTAVLLSAVVCGFGCAPTYRTRMEELDSETWYEVPELRMPQPGASIAEPENNPSQLPVVLPECAQPDSAGTRNDDAGPQVED
jgi:hypothetical protein